MQVVTLAACGQDVKNQDSVCTYRSAAAVLRVGGILPGANEAAAAGSPAAVRTDTTDKIG